MQLPFDTSRPIPILFLSDAPECTTGLARIGRDLASLVSTLPQFRVGYLGRGGVGRRSFPWTQYQFPEAAQWGEDYLPRVWSDFSNGQRGIVMSLWDASRMLWFGAPQTLKGYPEMQRFLGDGRGFEKWGYFPQDCTGVDPYSLPMGMLATMRGYDRTLFASEWASSMALVAGLRDPEWLPHGLWTNVFYPYGNAPVVRETLGWDQHSTVLGCNMANQARKDWPVAFETAAILRVDYGNAFKFWAHTDTPQRYWDLFALAAEYGMSEQTELTMDLSDHQLAQRYSACDCTILPSGGEGFGYPIAESMACGTACIVTNYAAGQELVPEECRSEPVAERIDTMHNVRRAVLSAHSFANRARTQIEAKQADWQGQTERWSAQVAHLDWTRLRFEWEKWFLKGIGK